MAAATFDVLRLGVEGILEVESEGVVGILDLEAEFVEVGVSLFAFVEVVVLDVVVEFVLVFAVLVGVVAGEPRTNDLEGVEMTPEEALPVAATLPTFALVCDVEEVLAVEDAAFVGLLLMGEEVMPGEPIGERELSVASLRSNEEKSKEAVLCVEGLAMLRCELEVEARMPARSGEVEREVDREADLEVDLDPMREFVVELAVEVGGVGSKPSKSADSRVISSVSMALTLASTSCRTSLACLGDTLDKCIYTARARARVVADASRKRFLSRSGKSSSEFFKPLKRNFTKISK